MGFGQMNQALSKFLPLFLYPVGLTLLLLLLGILCYLFGRRRFGIILAFLAAVLLYVSSIPATAHFLARTLESRYEQPGSYSRVPAIVLLGGAGVPSLPPRRYPETNQNADRLMHAARLHRQGYARYIIPTGGKNTIIKDFEGSEAEINASLLRELFGIAPRDIIVETESRNTREHGPAVRAIMEQKKLPLEVIVVTSALHMPRAVKVFEKAGFTVHPAPTDFRADEILQRKVMNFMPQASALVQTTAVLHEYYGTAVYAILD